MTDAKPRDSRSALDMSGAEFRAIGHALVDEIAEFFDTLSDRRLTRDASPDDIRRRLGTDALPETGTDPATLFAEIAPLLFDYSLHNGHPKFLGYITSSAAPLGALADLLAAAVNANVGKWDLAPIASEIEAQTVRWLADLIRYERDCSGLMVSGGNMANILGFIAGRTAKASWDIRAVGNYGNPRRMTAYVSAETHTWIQKAADICGLGSDGIRWVDTDADGRMRVDHLVRAIRKDRGDGRLPFLAVATAGSVSTGIVDPMQDIAAVCREHDLWLHADGAYGAPAAVVPEVPEDLRSLRLADSVALDPHKWLYCPLEAACVLTRDAEALQNAFAFYPEYYMLDDAEEEGVNYYQLGLQNSRGFRALKVWMALRAAGRDGYRDSIREDIGLAGRLFELVDAHAEFVAHSVHLSIATFRFVPEDLAVDAATDGYLNELNRRLIGEIQAGGDLYVSNAVVAGRYLLRACIVNFRTSRQDIDELPEAIAAIGRRLDRQLRGEGAA
ncbi:MAG: aminotransferase class V-fold PLP-dependent enzyme [Woeseiaceae bacterium]|jgi:aromatic-L-amino-acid/L-tryptophan decarboxylase